MNYRKICLLAAVIAFASAPICAQAYQISPNPNHGQIDVFGQDAENDDNFVNYGTLNDYGILLNNSQLYNNGYLNNYNYISNGFLSLLANSGTLNNNSSASLTNHATGTMINYSGGVLNNDGALYTSSTLYNYSGGTLTNSGTLENGSRGSLVNSGTLNNYGTLVNHRAGLLHPYYGSLSNDWGGTLTNYSGATLTNEGKLLNQGTLINYGTITGTGTYLNSSGLTKNMGSLSQASITIGGGILSGTGSVEVTGGTHTVNVNPRAIVQPGDDPGTLTIIGNFSTYGRLLIDIASGSYGVLDISGSATFNSGSTIEFDFLGGYVPSAGNSWDFLLAQSITGLDNNVSFIFSGLPAGLSGEFTFANGVESLILTGSVPVPPPPVPVPPSAWLFLSGLAGLGLMRRGRRRKKS